MTGAIASPHVVILGGGPAGLGAAYRLRRADAASVTVVERGRAVGGAAGSFEFSGLSVDHGSHRLHPACPPEILADLRALLGEDLLDRPRRGRIRLRGRWIRFPLEPADLLARLDARFAAGVAIDAVRASLRARARGGPRAADDASAPPESFAAELLARLGPTICREFYFPYARKIWGRAPEDLSVVQARRRVAVRSLREIAERALMQTPGLERPGARRFFYPRGGFGRIGEAYAEAARAAGARILLGSEAVALVPPADASGAWSVRLQASAGLDGPLSADLLFSTIPITTLPGLVTSGVPEAVRPAAASLEHRAMLLVYLALDVDRLTRFDAHYLPEEGITVARVSEPKNYSGPVEPLGRTVLCAEVPCSPSDPWWALPDEEIAEEVVDEIARAGLPLPRPPSAIGVRRLRHAYPIYARGFEAAFETLEAWADGLPGLVTFGRQGLFAHDNTHHALAMAYRAAECLAGGRFDRERWRAHREEFAGHVVED